MNNEMAYLLGMIVGNGCIQRGARETTVSVDIPHKKLKTELSMDVRVYVKASISDIQAVIEPLIATRVGFAQESNVTVLSFRKSNDDYLTRELLRYTGSASSHEYTRVHADVHSFSRDERLHLLRGFGDVTGYIRRSNYFFSKYMHRTYLEVPHNWELVADICNLLKSVDIPVQTVDWAHPNMRDPLLVKYKQGYPHFWKKEHQIKIWANEYLPVGYGVLHKREALERFSHELEEGLKESGRTPADVTHRFYWETSRDVKRPKPKHPSEDDPFIPAAIRGRHYDSWKEIARDLGYKE